MTNNQYHFVDRWRVEADVREVADILEDALAQPIQANKSIIEKLSFLLKPIFRSNHNWTMNRGEQSLRLELLRRRAKSDAELANIPPAPRPSVVVRFLRLNS